MSAVPVEVVDGSLAARVPRSIPEFHESLTQLFHCMQGVPRAYMEIAAPPPYPPGSVLRGVYSTLRFAVRAAAHDDTIAMLVGAIWHEVVGYRRHYDELHRGSCPLLFWRMVPHVDEFPAIPDGYDGNGAPVAGRATPVTVISCRLWVPGVAIPSSELGAEPTYVE